MPVAALEHGVDHEGVHALPLVILCDTEGDPPYSYAAASET